MILCQFCLAGQNWILHFSNVNIKKKKLRLCDVVRKLPTMLERIPREKGGEGLEEEGKADLLVE